MMTSNQLSPLLSKPWKPDAGQKKGVKFFLENAVAGCLADPGVGKTSISLAAVKILKKQGLVRKVLVIAPLRPAYMVWPKEIEKWTDFKDLTYTILHGPNKDEALKEDVDIYITNLEGLEWLLDVKKTKLPTGKIKVEVDRARFKALGFDLVIFDELSKFKTVSTIRFKAIKLIVGLFPRRWGLTGSPASNGLMGLFGQCYVLDEGRTFGPFITHYRLKYFDLLRDGFTYKLKEGAEQLIYKAIRPLMLRLEAKDLPPAVDHKIMVRLPPAAMKIYKEVEKDFFSKIESKVITAANSGVANILCRQVANGAIYTTPELEGILKIKPKAKEWLQVHDEKIKALQELVDELQGQPLLVAYEFKHDLERIKAAMGDIPHIGGGVTPKRASELEEKWNRGELPMLLGHPQSIGHGCNLQGEAYRICWFSQFWDFEVYDQFIRRLRRRGQKAPRVYNYKLLAEGTTDEDIDLTMHSKDATQQDFLEAMKKRIQR